VFFVVIVHTCDTCACAQHVQLFYTFTVNGVGMTIGRNAGLVGSFVCHCHDDGDDPSHDDDDCVTLGVQAVLCTTVHFNGAAAMACFAKQRRMRGHPKS
jgi:hypothetical protein